jgi:hypothetical protein
MLVTLRVKREFFDKKIVQNVVGVHAARWFEHAAAYIRKAARNSIKYRKEAAPAGRPPSAHRKAAAARKSVPAALAVGLKTQTTRLYSPLKEMIFYDFDYRTASMVIGPSYFSGPGIIGGVTPRVLELGGMTGRRANPRRTLRFLGGSGEIRTNIHGRWSQSISRKGMKEIKGRYGESAAYAKLKTPAQVARANRINEFFYGPDYLPSVHIAARPYMNPALARSKSVILSLFAQGVV